MRVFKIMVLPILALVFVSCSSTQKMTYKNSSKNRFAYLDMNGEFVMNKKDSMTVNDKRNFSKILLSTSAEKGTITKMTFFEHSDSSEKVAECGYQYIASYPDPYYFPNTSKTSIWDVFEKVANYSGECEKYPYVISRSPHDSPIHMHLRYGDDVKKLLEMSKAPKDNQYNPWWADYDKVK